MTTKERIKTDDTFLKAALLTLYRRGQTADEQMTYSTKYDNGIGFNGVDAPILSDLARFLEERGYLTPKQIDLVRKKMIKYSRQLEAMGVDTSIVPSATSRVPESDKTKVKSTPTARPTSSKLVDWDGAMFSVRFPYDPKLVAYVKALRGRSWNPTLKTWSVKNTADNRAALRQMVEKMGFEATDEAKSILDDSAPLARTEVTVEIDDVISKMGVRPMPFQVEGIKAGERAGWNILIGDEMGLGKTLQAIGALQAHPEWRPAIIVCPASVKLNWRRELKRVLRTKTDKIHVLSGTWNNGSTEKVPEGTTILIANYDILSAKIKCHCGGTDFSCKACRGKGYRIGLRPDVAAFKPQILIVDECQYIKNAKAQRTKAVLSLGRIAKHKICLSGTPIENRPVEFFSTLRMIAPTYFSNFWDYAKRYCGARHNGFGWDFSGATRTDELNNLLVGNGIMIRRRKEEVLTDLPPKRRIVVPMWLKDRTAYDKALAKLEAELESEDMKGAKALVRIEALKQLTVEQKMPAVLQWIADYLETEDKLVIFADHQKTIDTLMKAYEGQAVKIDGRTPNTERQKAVDLFQNDPKIRLFIGSKAAAEGITLTAAKAVAFVELWWTPGKHVQAEDRIHRIGQQADSVTAYYLLADGTIEETIAELLDAKSKILNEVLDGGEAEETNLIDALIAKLKEKKQ